MKILLAYDGFEHSENALGSVATLAEADGAEVTILSVVPPDARGSKAGGHVGIRPHAHEDVARGHAYLRERGIASEMQIEHGDPVEEIVRVAREGGYDLIVTGSRGRGPVGEVLLGSVSKALVRTAPCGVLVAGKEAETRFEPAGA
jgi:nucleotide-binding universal stress UspA family protein